MTNWEYYKDDEEFQKICSCGAFAIQKIDNNPVLCNNFDCKKCIFKQMHGGCYTLRKQWLDEEYQEQKEPEVDWSKIEVDTPILVSMDERNWNKMYFARYNETCDMVAAFDEGTTSWSNATGVTHWKYAKLAESEDK